MTPESAPVDEPHVFAAPRHVVDDPIAPWWHTVAVVLLLVGWAVGAHASTRAGIGRVHWITYLSSVMMQWMLLGTCVAGVYRRGEFFARTLRQNARPWWVELCRGIVLYLGMMLLFGVAASVLTRAVKSANFDSTRVHAMRPSNLGELLLWTGVALSAGFCEEHVFRGYLLRQAMAWCERWGLPRLVAAALSTISLSVLFGSLHLYEGYGGAILITLLGVLFSVVALRMRNLRVVIVAHFLQDFVSIAYLVLRHNK